LELRCLEEPATHVILTQQGNPRPRRKAALGHGEREGALHYGQLPVDGRVLRPLGLSPENVATNVGGADRGHAATAEERGEVEAHVALDVDERSLSVDAVVVQDVAGGGAEGQAGSRTAPRSRFRAFRPCFHASARSSRGRRTSPPILPVAACRRRGQASYGGSFDAVAQWSRRATWRPIARVDVPTPEEGRPRAGVCPRSRCRSAARPPAVGACIAGAPPLPPLLRPATLGAGDVLETQTS